MKKFVAAMFVVVGLVASVAQAKEVKSAATINFCDFASGQGCY